MQWMEEYAVGVDEIDEQHKGIIDLFTVINTAIAQREGWADLFFKLEKLREHARFHFAIEESLMRMHSYPKHAEHAEQHRHFLDKLDQLQMTTLSRQVTMNTIDYLANWYPEHMKTLDRDFVRYLIDHGKVNLTHPPAA
ncbi:MAG: hemerythrin family protein [Gammaproteobacteria bacterium]|nr:hemerythrin family protein [Gammaproteobacteria bacterium]MBU1777848.1 hemerythrin family protein [Gammaproteobacteria bacterium]MBU1969290.1 hemerythrin family protein [Gammaproteobacteria bacterium]